MVKVNISQIGAIFARGAYDFGEIPFPFEFKGRRSFILPIKQLDFYRFSFLKNICRVFWGSDTMDSYGVYII